MTTRQSLMRKASQVRTSGKMAAIVGYILDMDLATPAIVEMAITADGFVLAGVTGDVGMNEFIGAEADLRRNWNGFLDAAEASEAEFALAWTLYARKIRSWRR